MDTSIRHHRQDFLSPQRQQGEALPLLALRAGEKGAELATRGIRAFLYRFLEAISDILP